MIHIEEQLNEQKNNEAITTDLIKQIEELNSYSNSVNWDRLKMNTTIKKEEKANSINVDDELSFLD